MRRFPNWLRHVRILVSYLSGLIVTVVLKSCRKPKMYSILERLITRVLPAYARQFDICFIPFAPGEIAKTTLPLKLFEYFALEKPVVVTSEMLECVAFKEVFSGDSASALSQAIDAAIQVKNDAGFKKRLAELAEENDWEARAKAMEFIFQCN